MLTYCEVKTEEGVLRGMLNRPEQKKYPLVLMLHGFTANRNGPRFAFVRLANALEKLGIGSIRFDFLGSGESDGEFSSMTYQKEFKQAICILEEISKLEDVTEIYVLGHSMGGAIAGQLAASFPKTIKKCALWAPAFCMPNLISYLASVTKPMDNGYYDCKGLDLSQEFVDEITKLDLCSGLDRYTNPLMIIHATTDETVPFKSSELYLNSYHRDDIQFLPLEGGSHNYEVNREVHFVLDNTIKFFAL